MSMEVTTIDKIRQQLTEKSYTWLITGVAGFIGSNLLETLLKLNQKVIGLDNFATGFQSNLDDVLSSVSAAQQNNFTFYRGDICHYEDCENSVREVDYVLHQAALGSVPRSIRMPRPTNDTNVTGFLNMLLAAKEAKVKRFIYASSSSVYGDSPELPKVESKIGNPLSPYAVSKYTNELYAKAFATCYGMENIGLRYFNVFGARQNPEGQYAAVIPLWIQALLGQTPIYINGDGETSRDFCYIDNAVQANLLAALTDDKSVLNKVYNITFGEKTTLNQLAKLIAANLNKEFKPQYREFREGDIRHSVADITASRNALGYRPHFSVADGLKQTVAWYLARQSCSLR